MSSPFTALDLTGIPDILDKAEKLGDLGMHIIEAIRANSPAEIQALADASKARWQATNARDDDLTARAKAGVAAGRGDGYYQPGAEPEASGG